jgi:mRNA interferase MazF
VALADQIKSLDWKARKAKGTGTAAPGELAEVRGKIIAVIG